MHCTKTTFCYICRVINNKTLDNSERRDVTLAKKNVLIVNNRSFNVINIDRSSLYGLRRTTMPILRTDGCNIPSALVDNRIKRGLDDAIVPGVRAAEM